MIMPSGEATNNQLRKYKLVFLGEQSGMWLGGKHHDVDEKDGEGNVEQGCSSWQNVSDYTIHVRYVWQHIPGEIFLLIGK